jgi:hypothetical protein
MREKVVNLSSLFKTLLGLLEWEIWKFMETEHGGNSEETIGFW